MEGLPPENPHKRRFPPPPQPLAPMSTDISLPSPDDNQLIAERREKLAELRATAKEEIGRAHV